MRDSMLAVRSLCAFCLTFALMGVSASAAMAAVPAPTSSEPDPLTPASPSPGPSISNPRNPAPPREGDTLQASDGTWGSGVSTSRKWLRCTGDGTDYNLCNDTGQTGTTYVLTASDVGTRLRLRVTGTVITGQFREVDSNPTDAVVDPPTNTAAPTVSGSPAVGRTLSAGPGSWTGTPTITFAYQWQRCSPGCSNISGARASSYRVGSSDVSKQLRVVVTATNAGGSSAVASKLTGKVPAPPPALPALLTGKALTVLSPFPVVRLSGLVLGRFTRIRRLIVSAPRGASVTVRCRGRGCPYRRASRRVGTARVRFRRLERRLRAGAVIVVIVTRADTIGKYTRIRFRSRRVPVRRDYCYEPRSRSTLDCPS